jgi:hypothetical protein
LSCDQNPKAYRASTSPPAATCHALINDWLIVDRSSRDNSLERTTGIPKTTEHE